jgi:hypothetical protein
MLERGQGLPDWTGLHVQEILWICGTLSDLRTQLGHLFRLDSHYRSSQKTTTPSSVDYVWKLCLYVCIVSGDLFWSSGWDWLFLRDATEEVSPSPHLKTETVPVSETLCFLEFRTMDKVDKPSDSSWLSDVLSVARGNLQYLWLLMEQRSAKMFSFFFPQDLKLVL